ncbi:hypothetical protein Kyoto91A_00380 [Helicobacter pylori]
MVTYQTGTALSRFVEACFELKQDIDGKAKAIERVLNNYFLARPDSILAEKIRRHSSKEKDAQPTEVRVSIEPKRINPFSEEGSGVEFEFSLWVDAENKRAICDYEKVIREELPLEFFDEFYRVKEAGELPNR